MRPLPPPAQTRPRLQLQSWSPDPGQDPRLAGANHVWRVDPLSDMQAPDVNEGLSFVLSEE